MKWDLALIQLQSISFFLFWSDDNYCMNYKIDVGSINMSSLNQSVSSYLLNDKHETYLVVDQYFEKFDTASKYHVHKETRLK